jgi:hypothetical protein
LDCNPLQSTSGTKIGASILLPNSRTALFYNAVNTFTIVKLLDEIVEFSIGLKKYVEL